MSSRVEELLEELVRLQKASEGYFIYTSTAEEPAVEAMLAKFSISYNKRATLLADLTEYVLIGSEDVINAVRDEILASGVKAYFSRQRLPISGTLGTINAIAEKAKIYGWHTGTNQWKALLCDVSGNLHTRSYTWVYNGSQWEALKSTNNAAWVHIKASDLAPAGTVVSGQATPGTTSTQIVNNAHKASRIVLKAASGNTGIIKIGASGAEVHELAAGEELVLHDCNVAELYAIGNGTDVLSYVYTY